MADAFALNVTDVVWLEVADVLALVGTDVEPEDEPVLVSEADILDVAVDVAVEMLLRLQEMHLRPSF